MSKIPRFYKLSEIFDLNSKTDLDGFTIQRNFHSIK